MIIIIKKYKYLPVEKALPSGQTQTTEDAKFTYSPKFTQLTYKAFKKQIKIIENQEE